MTFFKAKEGRKIGQLKEEEGIIGRMKRISSPRKGGWIERCKQKRSPGRNTSFWVCCVQKVFPFYSSFFITMFCI